MRRINPYRPETGTQREECTYPKVGTAQYERLSLYHKRRDLIGQCIEGANDWQAELAKILARENRARPRGPDALRDCLSENAPAMYRNQGQIEQAARGRGSGNPFLALGMGSKGLFDGVKPGQLGSGSGTFMVSNGEKPDRCRLFRVRNADSWPPPCIRSLSHRESGAYATCSVGRIGGQSQRCHVFESKPAEVSISRKKASSCACVTLRHPPTLTLANMPESSSR